ncbi:MAG: hypothetical protein H0W21_13740 [Actinobacteria bacterium]|nr:hypothetical protein [Actinomycetota bacterium]
MNKSIQFLRIYLNDHLAGATLGVELAKRSQRSNKGTPLGDFLAEFAAEASTDKAHLEELMEVVGAGKNMMKSRAAWVAEKVGRLKGNGQLTGYSDLSRLIELEGLMIGVTGKIGLWRSLVEAFPPPQPPPADFQALLQRAEDQLGELQRRHKEAAAEAFGLG